MSDADEDCCVRCGGTQDLFLCTKVFGADPVCARCRLPRVCCSPFTKSAQTAALLETGGSGVITLKVGGKVVMSFAVEQLSVDGIEILDVDRHE